jgi:hypothetical protein
MPEKHSNLNNKPDMEIDIKTDNLQKTGTIRKEIGNFS